VSKNVEFADTLVKLGLGRPEASVFIALLTLGTADSTNISKISGISRSNTYRALDDLVDLGLIQKHISKPSRYKPLSVYEAFSILIKKREATNITLYKKATEFNDLFRHVVSEPTTSETGGQFMLIPEGDAMRIKLDKMAETVSTLDIKLTLKQILPWLNGPLAKKLIKKAKPLRLLTENSEMATKTLSNFSHIPSVEIKVLPPPLKVTFGLFNNKEILVTVQPDKMFSQSPVIWSCNEAFARMAKGYFDFYWSKALKFDMVKPTSRTT
jgi:HTH-type transcriptional regulator, sugar sensing transcriptional regulator